MGQIYISTLAFKGKTPQEIIKIAEEHNFAVEFTSSFRDVKGLQSIYLHAAIPRMAHNYFPPPKVPFVLNLASKNELIRDRSIAHCINGLQICKNSNAPFFAAHAGFCIDPSPNELGNKIAIEDDFDRAKHLEIFVSSLDAILQKAEELNITFLIENNVLITANQTSRKENPLLCCESTDISWLFNTINSPHLGLLLDTAHLKVSSRTLGLNEDLEVGKLKKYIKAIHHSDNNGLIDNNQPLETDYWFLKHMKDYKNLVHVIEVSNIRVDVVKEHINLLEKYGS